VTARIALLDRDEMKPGESVLAQVTSTVLWSPTARTASLSAPIRR
jgi:hypothetical protein